MKAVKFKTKTGNNRIALTRIFKPQNDLVVVNQRVLANKQDVSDGWFQNFTQIYSYKEFVLLEVQMVFWVDSFKAVIDSFNMLEK